MKRCRLCLMPDTRPGISFNDKGICLPCQHWESQKKVDWSKRWLELEELCRNYRKNNGEYDCIITVSGGKDSHFQVGLFKEKLGMHPLCIMVDNFSWTDTGRMNFYNLSKRFGVDMITFTSNLIEMKERIVKDFVNYCHPMRYWDEILYRKPLELAQKLGIPLVVWGENTSLTFGGPRDEESPDAKRLIPDPENFADLEVIFTSYYVPWSRFYNAEYARKNGFKYLSDTGEWNRLGLEGFEFQQIDTIGYLVNQYCKFVKFGFSNVTELCSDSIRHGLMTREQGLERVKNDDWKLDPKILVDFLKFSGLVEDQFWEVIERHANKELLEKGDDNFWHLKESPV